MTAVVVVLVGEEIVKIYRLGGLVVDVPAWLWSLQLPNVHIFFLGCQISGFVDGPSCHGFLELDAIVSSLCDKCLVPFTTF